MSENLVFKYLLYGFFRTRTKGRVLTSRTILRICCKLSLEYFNISNKVRDEFVRAEKLWRVKDIEE